MAKKFSELRAGMSPSARAKAASKAKASTAEICNDDETDEYEYQGSREAACAQDGSGSEASGKKAQECGHGRRSRARG
jgi:hypothetical protein